MELAINNLQSLICHKTQTNKQTINAIYLNVLSSIEINVIVSNVSNADCKAQILR